MRISLNRTVFVALCALLLQFVSFAARAHHSHAMFDMENCRTLEGAVWAFEMKYPHLWLWLQVPDKDGKTTTWGFEGASPTQFAHIDPRWTPTVVRKGDTVKVKFGPLRDGRPGGAIAAVTLANGQTLSGSRGLCEQQR